MAAEHVGWLASYDTNLKKPAKMPDSVPPTKRRRITTKPDGTLTLTVRIVAVGSEPVRAGKRAFRQFSADGRLLLNRIRDELERLERIRQNNDVACPDFSPCARCRLRRKCLS